MKWGITKKTNVFICILLCLSLLSGCTLRWKNNDEDVTSGESKTSHNMTDKPSKDGVSESGNEEIVIGSLSKDGYVLNIEENTIGGDKEVSVEVLNSKERTKIENPGKYELLGEPVKFLTDAEEAAFFAGNVKYTVPIPEEILQDPTELNSLFFVYYDDERDEVRYLFPDEYDEETKSFSIYLPHFSFWGSAELTDEQKVEAFLDKYSMDEAIRRSDLQQAAAALEPYINAKLKDLKLLEEVKKDIVWSCVEFLVGKYSKTPGEKLADKIADQEYMFGQTFRDVSSPEDIQHLKSLLGTSTEALTRAGLGIYRSASENDPEKFKEQLDVIVSQNYLSYLIDNMNKDNPRKKYYGPIGKIVGNASTLAEAAGHLTERQYKAGLEALVPIAEDIIINYSVPTAATIKAMQYLEAKGRQVWTNWKSNQVEELYQLFKNGSDKVKFKNQIEPQDEASFLHFLDYGSGPMLKNSIMRFYRMDKVAEMCEMYGWGRKEYDELDDTYKKEFNRRAFEGLMNYFRTRLAQENEAERIKEYERECVKTMLEPGGCLQAYAYLEFFGEKEWSDYDITNRLHRIMDIRTNISGFINIEKLEKDREDAKQRNESYYNHGDILNLWVQCMSENMKNKNTAIHKFKEHLKAIGYLHPDYMMSLYPTLDQLVGVYTGEIVPQKVEFTELSYPDDWNDKQGAIKKDIEAWEKYVKGKPYSIKSIEITKIDDTHGRITMNSRLDPFDFEYSDEEGLIVSTAEAILKKTKNAHVLDSHLDLIIGKFNLQTSYSKYSDKIELIGTYKSYKGVSGITGSDGENFAGCETSEVNFKKDYSRYDD